MKIRDLICKMSDNTEILIYESYEECKMPSYGNCGGDCTTEYDCRDCSAYIGQVTEFTKYHGNAGECPIKLAEYIVKEINNAYHEVGTGTGRRRKTEKCQLIAIRVN